VAVAVRPEKMRLCPDCPDPGENCVSGQVQDIAYLGNVSIYHVRVSPEQRRDHDPGQYPPPYRAEMLTWGQEVTMAWSPVCGVVLTD
jgi:putrescine transport system ATP-binding protein